MGLFCRLCIFLSRHIFIIDHNFVYFVETQKRVSLYEVIYLQIYKKGKEITSNHGIVLDYIYLFMKKSSI